jgi:hypothetical protein
LKKVIIILSLLIAIAGCECVPGLNTDKITEPVNNSKLMIFNGISDLNEINIYSDEFLLYENLKTNTSTNDYLKFPVNSSGYLAVWNNDNSFRLINLPLNLEKDKYYTLILSGTSDEPEFIILEDFTDMEAETGILRVVNITKKSIMMVSKATPEELSFLLKGMQRSQNIVFSDAMSALECYVDEQFLFTFDAHIKAGEMNTMIVYNLFSEPYYYIIRKENPF